MGNLTSATGRGIVLGMQRRHVALILGVGSLLACGISVVGADELGAPKAPPPASPNEAAASTLPDDSGAPIELPPDLDAASDAESGAGQDDASFDGCVPTGDPCSDSPSCCTAQCTVTGQCGSCSSQVGTRCDRQGDCCLGTFCGRYADFLPFACQSCLAPGSSCTDGVECCSGACTGNKNHPACQ
jgi:hypothetical protein